MNVILRPVYNRPEMLKLSFDYEFKSRSCVFKSDRPRVIDSYITIFVVEFGADPKCIELINEYPYDKIIIQRQYRHKPIANILEGIKTVLEDFPIASYVINLEDDCLVHETFFEFASKASRLVEYSVINSWGVQGNDPYVLNKGSRFAGPGGIINLDFFREFILPYVSNEYYDSPDKTISKINALHKGNPFYKYKEGMQHTDWDGLIHRLVDVAFIEKGLYSYSSDCYRLLHIGFYGYNRTSGKWPESCLTFEDRLNFLRSNIFDPALLESLDGTYKDYSVFCPEIDLWDGRLFIG